MSIIQIMSRCLRSAALVCMTLAGTAWAQAPQSSLSLIFLDPTGVVGPSDAIPIYLRLSNNDPSLAFVVDGSLPDGGLDPALLPTTGTYWDPATAAYVSSDFASYTWFNLSVGFGCSGSFTAAGLCTNGPPYTFSFAANPFSNPFTLAAGDHIDYLFGSFVPTSGPVAAGSYEFYRSVIWLDVYGVDANGTAISTVLFPAQTCTGDSAAACASSGFFTRVVAVPEPETYALMVLGLAMLGWQLRRREQS